MSHRLPKISTFFKDALLLLKCVTRRSRTTEREREKESKKERLPQKIPFPSISCRYKVDYNAIDITIRLIYDLAFWASSLEKETQNNKEKTHSARGEL